MTTYVDDMRAPFGRMLMCHMIADTTDELVAMAARIGVQRKWIQYPGTPKEHFDIATSKKALAIAAGAVPITMRQCATMSHRRRVTGELGHPDDAERWLRDLHQPTTGETP